MHHFPTLITSGQWHCHGFWMLLPIIGPHYQCNGPETLTMMLFVKFVLESVGWALYLASFREHRVPLITVVVL